MSSDDGPQGVSETTGAAVLFVSAVVAVLWANSPWHASYESLWHVATSVSVHSWSLHLDLRHVVDDGLMVVFFFAAGLEIKHELVDGDLRNPRTAALPAFAALGGMVVPAGIFVAFTAGSGLTRGWGIPMATDIAFALGVVALFGTRLPSALRLFLLTLAIVDDIGAIIVIAVFYSGDVQVGPLAGAVALLVVMVSMRRLGVTRVGAYLAVGVAVWLCTFESGIHATIAGVAMGLLTPAPVAAKLQRQLLPLTTFVVVPLFALANAGVRIDVDSLGSHGPRTVLLAVVAGLVVGKIVGVTAFAWLAVRLGLGHLPAELSWAHVVGVAAVAGIGFTVSLFVADLAFVHSAELDAAAKTGVMVASVIAALLGGALLWRSARSGDPDPLPDATPST